MYGMGDQMRGDADEIRRLKLKLLKIKKQRDSLYQTLLHIRKIDGPGLDGSPEGTPGYLARIALEESGI